MHFVYRNLFANNGMPAVGQLEALQHWHQCTIKAFAMANYTTIHAQWMLLKRHQRNFVQIILLLSVCAAIWFVLDWLLGQNGGGNIFYSFDTDEDEDDPPTNASSFLHQNCCSRHCLTRKSAFRRALLEQRSNGLPLRHFANGTVDVADTWMQIYPYFNQIWSRLFDAINVKKFDSGDEYKYFVPFLSHLPTPRECNVITLGVGHTVKAELGIRALYPECQFLAVDPSAGINADLVENTLGGKFVHAAVGAEANVQLSMVQSKDEYEQRMELQISIHGLLSKEYSGAAQQQSLVDLMIIDVEGAEFDIMEYFVDHYTELPVSICQINMEIHRPEFVHRNYTYPRFFRVFDRFLRNGNFALMHVDFLAAPFQFHRMFFVNIGEEVCRKKFIC